MSTTPPRRKRSATGRPSFLNEGSPEERLDRKRDAADMIGRKPEGDRQRLLLELDLLVDSKRAPAEPQSIRRVGKGTWRVQFGGSDVLIQQRLVGLWRYAVLLRRRREEIEATELEQLTRDAGMGDGAPPEIKELGLDTRSGRRRREWIDPKTEAALKPTWKRIKELEKLIERCGDFGSKEEADRLREERERLLKTVNEFGFRGRKRDDSAPAEKARKAVWGTFATARRRIGEKIPELAKYLDEHVSPRGTRFIFWPPPGDPGWEIETDF